MSAGSAFFVSEAHRDALAGRGIAASGALRAFRGDEPIKAARPGRTTERFTASGVTYYVKRITGDGAAEIADEAETLGALRAAGLPVAEVAAVAVEEDFGALVTIGLPVRATLEHVLLRELAPDDHKRRTTLLRRLAGHVRALHAAGVQHRDCYLGHVLVGDGDRLYWTDFGRALRTRRLSWLRRIKDLAALDFSAPPRVASDAERLRWLRRYAPRTPRAWLSAVARLVRAKARRMRRHAERMLARGAGNVHVNA